MARYRLKSAHYIEGDKYLLGDKEMANIENPRPPLAGQDEDHRGTVVGDGTPHTILWPTLEMEPLDDEAREMIAKEEARIRANGAAMDPTMQLSMSMDNDDYETRYTPGFADHPRGANVPHGVSVAEAKAIRRGKVPNDA